MDRGPSDTPGAGANPAAPVKLGKLKPGVESAGRSRGHRQCRTCRGFYFEGNWHHDLGCPETAVLWKRVAGELGVSAWPCACTPVETPETWTHAPTCGFWPTYEDEAIQQVEEEELPF